MIDFEGDVLRALPAGAPVEGVVSVDSNIEVIESNAYRNDVTNGWRLALRVRRHDDKRPGELRAFLRNGGTTLSETWSYILPVN
jgi:glucans biosynthesis protein